jgi:hypothetical protein
MTTGELLEQWREATRAAELAERLAKLARASVEHSDTDAVAAQEIAKLAQRAAKHAERTARIAREASDRALAFATENRSVSLADADAAVVETREEETAARDRYHEAERAARDRHGSDGRPR